MGANVKKEPTLTTTVKLMNDRPVDRYRDVAGGLHLDGNPEHVLAHREVGEYDASILDNPTVRVWVKAGWLKVVS